MAKNLIMYYSRKGENYVNGGVKKLAKGNTEICAEFIQKAVGGDLFQIETVKEYPADYYACIDEAKTEMQQKARPELVEYLDSIAEYDNIFICGPCWWGPFPMAVYSQIERLKKFDKEYFEKGEQKIPLRKRRGIQTINKVSHLTKM